jgi:hypothetical protein
MLGDSGNLDHAAPSHINETSRRPNEKFCLRPLLPEIQRPRHFSLFSPEFENNAPRLDAIIITVSTKIALAERKF